MKETQNNDIVFGKKWFEKHQSKLLWLLNTPVVKIWFRWIMRIRRYDCPMSETINRIEPNSFSYGAKFITEDKIEIKTDFRTHDKFAKRLYFAFKPLWHIIHFWDMTFANQISQQLNFGFDTLTAYPDPHPESATVDGITQRSVANPGEVWATHKAGAGTISEDTNGIDVFVQFRGATTLNQWIQLYRSMFLFDTSALPDDASISATVLSIAGQNKADPTSNAPTLNIYTTTPASNTGLVAADFSQYGTTKQCDSDVTYAGWQTGATYNAFTFNATGIGNVSLTGISKFGCREATYDVGSSTPTWGANAETFFACYFADTAGTTSDPKLVVTYTVAVGPTNMKTWNGLASASINTMNGLAIASVKTWNGLS